MQIPAQASQSQSKSVKAANKPQSPQKAAASNPTAQAAKVAQKKMARPAHTPVAQQASAPQLGKNNTATSIPRSYVMVVSSYENVAQNSEITGNAAEQLGKTIESRITELNKQARREIEELPVYQKLEIDDIQELGEEIADMLENEEEALKAFALLKNPVFANLMESNEGVHRSFAEMMQDNGEEKLLFGAIQTVSLMNKGQSKAAPGAVSVKA